MCHVARIHIVFRVPNPCDPRLGCAGYNKGSVPCFFWRTCDVCRRSNCTRSCKEFVRHPRVGDISTQKQGRMVNTRNHRCRQSGFEGRRKCIGNLWKNGCGIDMLYTCLCRVRAKRSTDFVVGHTLAFVQVLRFRHLP